MRAVVQRVSEACVRVGGEVCGSIGPGLLVYLGIDAQDADADVDYIVDKVRRLRVFPDEQDRMNHDVLESGGAVLVVSAFTVSADARKGRRPSFDSAAEPETAEAFYEAVCRRLAESGCRVERGRFRAMMDVRCVNAGPVCILLDSRRTV